MSSPWKTGSRRVINFRGEIVQEGTERSYVRRHCDTPGALMLCSGARHDKNSHEKYLCRQRDHPDTVVVIYRAIEARFGTFFLVVEARFGNRVPCGCIWRCPPQNPHVILHYWTSAQLSYFVQPNIRVTMIFYRTETFVYFKLFITIVWEDFICVLSTMWLIGGSIPPDHTRSHHIIPDHTRSFQIIPDHTGSYQIIPFHTYHTMSYQIILDHTRSYQIIPDYTRLYQIIPDHTRLYQIIPNQTMEITCTISYVVPILPFTHDNDNNAISRTVVVLFYRWYANELFTFESFPIYPVFCRHGKQEGSR